MKLDRVRFIVFGIGGWLVGVLLSVITADKVPLLTWVAWGGIAVVFIVAQLVYNRMMR